MAYADWIVDTSQSQAAYTGGDSGLEVPNSTVTPNPLTLQGTSCRLFQSAGSANQYSRHYYKINPATYPNLNQVPDTKGVQLSCWVRYSAAIGTAGAETFIKLGIKMGSSGAANYRGYRLAVGYYAAAGTFGTFIDVYDSVGVSRLNYTGDLTGLANSVWYQFRMEVIPMVNGSTVDRDLVIFSWNTGTEASPVWTTFRSFIWKSFAAYYPPWNDAGYADIGFCPWVRTLFTGGQPALWLDRVDARVKAW